MIRGQRKSYTCAAVSFYKLDDLSVDLRGVPSSRHKDDDWLLRHSTETGQIKEKLFQCARDLF